MKNKNQYQNDLLIFQDGKKIDGKILKQVNEKLFLVEITNENLQKEEKIGRLVHSWIEL